MYGKKDKECLLSFIVYIILYNEKRLNIDYNVLLEKIKVVEEKIGRKIGFYYIIL